MLRAVLDTNVFLRAILNSRSPSGRLLGEFTDRYSLITSQALIFEVLTVLSRPELQAKSPRVAQLDYATIMGFFERAELVEPEDIPPVSRDPKDDMLLACAKAAGADYLVSEDKDVLVLKEYAGTIICRPAEFVTILEGYGSHPG